MKISKINEIKLVFLLAVALITFISLLSFNEGDIAFLTSNPNISKSNVVGSFGAYLGWFLRFLIGFGAYAVPFFIGLWGITYLFKERPQKFYLRIFGIIFSIIATSSIFSLVGMQDAVYRFQRGGIVGLVFSNFLTKYLGTAGTFIVILVLFILSLLITADFLLFPFLAWLPKIFKPFIRALRQVSHGLVKEKVAIKPFAGQPEKIKAAIQKIAPGTNKEKLLRPARKESAFVSASAGEDKRVEKEVPLALYNTPYALPPVDLLTVSVAGKEEEIPGIKNINNFEQNSKILEDTLADFGIPAEVVEISEGPVITRYELKPARGVTIQRITALSDNIALAMKSVSIRVVAPIPGKGTVGVEIPNSKSSIVYLRDILESDVYKNSQSKLKLALGKGISGAPIIADLNDMPHLLIAGATGSGKTICVNGIITTLLYNASPDELRFIMVDPKRVELACFNNLPHLLAPVVTDSKKVSSALGWAVTEMEARYESFAGLGVRNIDGYNKRAKDEKRPVMPYIVIIIDELADLMLIAQQEIENTITRLAQLSRAVGIHMIIATQRPSVDVITGVIKANFPARISFKVASKVDSRTVIDMNGAEKLLGRGDMLFARPGSPKPVRIQGSLVSDEEISRIAAFIKSQRPPNFVNEILKTEDKPQYKKFEKDEIYEGAVKLVLQTKQASVSMLQRRLGVGYTRAARLIDMMEDENIIGPYQGSKPREILAEDLRDG